MVGGGGKVQADPYIGSMSTYIKEVYKSANKRNKLQRGRGGTSRPKYIDSMTT